jgi:hypothetical protein
MSILNRVLVGMVVLFALMYMLVVIVKDSVTNEMITLCVAEDAAWKSSTPAYKEARQQNHDKWITRCKPVFDQLKTSNTTNYQQ